MNEILAEPQHTHQKVPLLRKIAFAMGQTGWSLAVFGFTELIYQFYLPPDNGKPMFKAFVYQGAVFKVFTIVGILSAVGYIISAFMEPIVGSLSDRSTFKFGKRKTFMAASVVPFALVSAAVFFPLKDGIHSLNIIWLSVTVIAAFIIKCFYTTPYNALINEIAKEDKERLHIVMMLSIAYALGIGVGQTINISLSVFSGSMSNEAIFQLSVLVYAVVAMVLMMMPILFVEDNSGKHISKKELNYDQKHAGIFDNMREVWNDKNFRVLVIVELIYWFPQKIFVVAVPYIVAALLQLDNVYTAIILYSVGLASLVMYPLIDKLVDRFGKKKIMQSALLCLLISFSFTATIGLYKIPTMAFVVVYVLVNTYPTAVLGILPMALAGDNAEHDFRKTGIAKNASYFGLKTFMMKIGVAITSLIFPSLLLLGKTPDNPLGVRMVAVACVASSLLAFMVMRKYKDV
ncbi:MAG TPA: MFS transporter [Chitinophagales bacterium]|nr:MFS transporter [Chitinophagales bacterium]